MAKTIETILRDYVGDQVLTLAKMSAEIERLTEELAAAKEKAAPEGVKPNGRDPGRAPSPAPFVAPGAGRS